MKVILQFFNLARDFVFLLLCTATLTDYHLAKSCSIREKMAVLHQFLVYVFQFALIFILMTATLSIFLDQSSAKLLSGLIACSVILLEIKMISSIWTPQGIFSQGLSLKEFGLILMRIAVAFVFATAYAVGAELYFFSDDIDAQAELNNDHSNLELVAFFKAKNEDKKALRDLKQTELDKLSEDLAIKKQKQSEIANHLEALEVELIEIERLMEVELLGLENRPKGAGIRYQEYFNNSSAKIKEISIATTHKRQWDQEVEQLQGQYLQLQKNLDLSNQELLQFDALTAAAAHPDYEETIPLGLSARHRLLDQAKRHPEHGSSLVYFSWVIKLVMMTLELLPLLVKLFFSPASMITEKTVAQMRVDAGRVRIEAELEVEKLYEARKDGKEGLGEFRVLPFSRIEGRVGEV